MSLTVLDAGLYSLVVDAGRPNTRALGVPLGGAADRAALALGNALVGNPPDAPALEVTLAGPTLRAEARTACVLFGAPFSLTVANRPASRAGTTFTLEPGDVLKVGGTPSGVRGYLCVAGGFDAPPVLGSRTALERLTAGAVLACPASRSGGRSLPFLTSDAALGCASRLRGAVTLRCLPGPQRDWFAGDAFFAQTYRVSAASNRMGVRLTGEPLTRRPGELVSEPVAPGAVQITNDGLPVVLGVDGQTIGGYPKVAHVVRADLDRLAQLRPGEEVRFQQISIDEAEAAARARAARLAGWLLRLRTTAGELD
jgi:antagonist of KipI